MKEINIESKIYFGQLAEFSKEDQELIACAIEALDNSYAKYSNFNVGAAIRLSDGKIIKGANQENASFPAHAMMLHGRRQMLRAESHPEWHLSFFCHQRLQTLL